MPKNKLYLFVNVVLVLFFAAFFLIDSPKTQAEEVCRYNHFTCDVIRACGSMARTRFVPDGVASRNACEPSLVQSIECLTDDGRWVPGGKAYGELNSCPDSLGVVVTVTCPGITINGVPAINGWVVRDHSTIDVPKDCDGGIAIGTTALDGKKVFLNLTDGARGVLERNYLGWIELTPEQGTVKVTAPESTQQGRIPLDINVIANPDTSPSGIFWGWLHAWLDSSEMIVKIDNITKIPTVFVTEDKAYVTTDTHPEPLEVLQGYKVTVDRNRLTEPVQYRPEEVGLPANPPATGRKTVAEFNSETRRLYSELIDDQGDNYGSIDINFPKSSLHGVEGSPVINFEAITNAEIDGLIPDYSPVHNVPPQIQQLTDYIFNFQVLSGVEQDILKPNIPIKLELNGITNTSLWHTAKLYQYYCIDRDLFSEDCYQFAWIPVSGNANISGQLVSFDAKTNDPRLGLFAIFGNK